MLGPISTPRDTSFSTPSMLSCSIGPTRGIAMVSSYTSRVYLPCPHSLPGHNIVPGIVPIGTLLYHGRGDSNLPDGPDWTATDPEHSYIFCRGSSDAGCWHLTLIVSRPLQVLYFDGSSAAKMSDGPMDSQDVVGWGGVFPDRYFNERQRILDLCNWGKPFGIDGYVRYVGPLVTIYLLTSSYRRMEMDL